MKRFSLVIEQKNEETAVRIDNCFIKEEVVAVCLGAAIAKMKKDGNMSNDSVAALIKMLINVYDNENAMLENVTEIEFD